MKFKNIKSKSETKSPHLLQLLLYEMSRKGKFRSFHLCSAEMNPSSTHEDAGSIPGLTQWVKDPRLPLAVV